ncbi:MAG: twin-arginine translocase subunit TatC [Bacteroidia bacterium]|nr:twin-arginine translocase subunit TatC [Bacteroidia bacterium]
MEKDIEHTKEMSFLEHLEELRKHLVRSALIVLVFAVIVFIYATWIFDNVIFAPLRPDFFSYKVMCALSELTHIKDLCFEIKFHPLQALSASEQFFNHIWMSIVIGIILASPFILFELWKFIRPALKDNEANPVKSFIVISTSLFLTGVLFGYFILFPMSYNFLIHYQISEIGMVETHNTLEDYISLISTMVLVSGLIFELPVVIFLLAKLGLITSTFMKNYRKHAFVVILIIAAVITPSPDVASQMIVATPLYILYEISIFIAKSVNQ